MDQLLAGFQQVAAELPPEEVRGCFVKVLAFLTGLATRLPTTGSVTNARASDLAEMEFLTVGEVAEKLTLTEQNVYALLRRGDLPALRVGKHWRIDEGDLRLWIAKRKEAEAGNVCRQWKPPRKRTGAQVK